MAFKPGHKESEYGHEEMKRLISLYAQHRAEGFDKESFPDCDYRTIESHLEKYPDILKAEKRELEKSERIGRLKWEKQGQALIDGKVNGNATAWIFKGKNKYGYRDKVESEVTMKGKPVIKLELDSRDDDKGNAGI